MSTRGLIGVRVDNKDKFMYNHSDSYPSYLGVKVLTDLQTAISTKEGKFSATKLKALKKKAQDLELIEDKDTKPTKEQIERYKKYSNLAVSEQSYNDWYCLLHDLQGGLLDTLEAGIGFNSNSFINDSLFCEWAYVVNFDDNVLEIYKGFQKEPHNQGRYTSKESTEKVGENEYYPCALVKEYPLTDLPNEGQFMDDLEPKDE